MQFPEKPSAAAVPKRADQRIRVAFVIGSLGGGGSERQLLQLLAGIDRKRFAPLLYLLNRTGELLPQIPSDVPVFSFNDRYPRPRSMIPGRIHRLQVQELARFLRTRGVQVVYDRTWVSTLVAGPATRRAQVPRVSVVAVDPSHDLPQSGARFLRMKQRILHRSYREAVSVLTVSEDLRRIVQDEYGLPPERVIALRNPVDLQRIERLAAAAPPRWPPGRFHVVSAGRLQPQKGYRYLIDAVGHLVHARGLSQIQLHLLGTGCQEAELRAQVARQGLAHHVQFAGFLENPYGFYRQADLFCLASLYEGLPNVLLEALACGTRVLATDCPTGPREILAGGRFGRLVPPQDVQALADGIQAAVSDDADWSAATAAARGFIEQHYTLSGVLRRLEEILARAVWTRPSSSTGSPDHEAQFSQNHHA